MAIFYKICRLSDLDDGGEVRANVQGRQIIVSRDGSRVVACEQREALAGDTFNDDEHSRTASLEPAPLTTRIDGDDVYVGLRD